MKNLIVIAFISIFLFGCTSSQQTGNIALKDETQETISKKIKENKTTQDQIRKNFGDPENTYFDGGKEVWIYSFIASEHSGLTYIPFISLLSNKVDGNYTMKQLTILFSDNKTVYKYTFSNARNKANLKTGIM